MLKLFKTTIIISFALTMLLIISACSGENGASVAGTSQAEATEAAETTTGRLEPDLPDTKFDGVEIKFLGTSEKYGGGYYQTKDVWVADMNGEPFNDAVAERNRNLEERYDIVISYSDSDDVYSTVCKAVHAGDNPGDIIYGSWGNMSALSAAGALIDMNTLDYFDFTKPWWDINQISQTAIGGRVYYTAGELTTLDNGCTRFVYFNKRLIDDYSLTVPYELVNSGNWTLDNYIKLAGSVYEDLNGDGKPDEGDRFGTFREGGYQDFLAVGCGFNYVRLDGSGKPYDSFLSDNTFTMTDKIFNFLYDENACIDIGKFTDFGSFSNRYAYARSLFTQDQILFTIGGPLVIGEFRNMESDFGIVPMPKYNETQESYYDYVDVGTNMVGIAKTAADPGRSAFIMEAMAAESMYTLTPVYNETLLERKYTRDDDSVGMLAIINESRVYCLHLVFDIGGLKTVLSAAYSASKIPTMSDYEKVKDASAAKLDELYESFLKLE